MWVSQNPLPVCWRGHRQQTAACEVSNGCHSVGPGWHGGTHGEAELLASCYRESLTRADEVEAATVALLAIATGVNGYPIEAAAAIAVDTVRSTPTDVTAVIFVAFDQLTSDAYAELFCPVHACPVPPGSPVNPGRFSTTRAPFVV